MSTVKVSQLPQSSTPLVGDELVMVVQSGVSRQCTVADFQPTTQKLGPELVYVAAAGNNNDIDINITTTSRVLVDTTAGDATITGVDTTDSENGQLLVFTNTGPNSLTFANENGASLAVNQFYGVTDITLPPRGSLLVSRSATLSKLVMIV